MTTCVPLAVYKFQHCQIRRWSETHLDILWDDGKSTPSTFDYSPASIKLAQELGYGDDVTAMHLSHDAAHCLVATAEGLKVSPTLWHVAHRPFFKDWFIEEAKILAFQKYVQTGEIAEELRGLDKTTNLKALCLKLKDIVAQLQLPQNNRTVASAADGDQ